MSEYVDMNLCFIYFKNLLIKNIYIYNFCNFKLVIKIIY